MNHPQRSAKDFFRGRRRGTSSRRGRPSGDFSARSQIIRGAIDAFGLRGYADTTVEDILRSAGVSRRTFYKFFRNKEELFGHIFDRAVDILLAAVREAIADADTPINKIYAGIEAYLQVMALAGPLARVVLTEQYRDDSPFAAKRERALSEFRALIETEYMGSRSRQVDPLLMGGLLAALDYVSVQIAQSSSEGGWDVPRGKRVMLRIIGAALADPEDPLPPLPLAGEA